ncbi:hypothetical protein [Tunturiibacter empetritectus]|nr:hypothetical protein [Edaphobacter lichenicola]
MPPLLLKLWREQHPKGHEQTNLDFKAQRPIATPVPLFEGTLISAGSVTHPASLTVSLQSGLPQTAEVLIILPFQRVTRRAQIKSTQGSAVSVEQDPSLNRTLHSYAPDEIDPVLPSASWHRKQPQPQSNLSNDRPLLD